MVVEARRRSGSLTGRRIANAIRRLLGWETPCSRVQARLYAYAWCEPDLSETECAEILRHLAVCECCRAEFDEIEAAIDAVGPLLYPDDALPPFDVEAMAKSITERIDCGDTGPESALVHEFMQGCEPRFADESPYRGLCQGAFAWLGAHKRLAAMAACVLLLVAGPVLAHVAGALRGYLDGAEPVGETGEQVASHRKTLPIPEMPGDAMKPGEADASASAREIDSDITDSLDAELARQAARAEVEAMLPHTEAEYEAWARREYPHIMWLYDVLMGKQGLTQAERGTSGDGSVPAFPPPPDSPAGRLVSFGMTDDGNPTITLPDAEGNKVTLCAVSEKRGLPSVRASHNHASERDYGWLSPGFRESIAADETGLESSTPITLTIPSEPWDGVPANIPEWAQRLYADTPESERPTGWRALLIYSGEIFKFDFPETLNEPNCIPTSEAIHWALPIGDAAYAFPPDNPESGTLINAQPLSPKDPYIIALARDLPRAKSVVQFAGIASLLRKWDEAACSAHITLNVVSRLHGSASGECSESSVEDSLTRLLNAQETPSGATWADSRAWD